MQEKDPSDLFLFSFDTFLLHYYYNIQRARISIFSYSKNIIKFALLPKNLNLNKNFNLT